MQKIVLTIKEDVCKANGKDEAKQRELINVMAHYGTVEDYDKVMSAVKAEYQATINNIQALYDSIADQHLTPHEIALVKCFRGEVSAIEANHVAEENRLANELLKIKQDTEQRLERLRAVLGD